MKEKNFNNNFRNNHIINVNEIEFVLFDKDGTLLDLPSIWIPWLSNICIYLSEKLDVRLINNINFEIAFGVDRKGGLVDPKGPLAISTIEESKVIVAYLLYTNGVPWNKAVQYADESIHFANTEQGKSIKIKLINDVYELLNMLNNYGIKLGVLTSDETEKSKIQLERLGILKYFSFIIGSDLVDNGKPFPDMAFLARDKYKVDLSKSIMIGDTNADMELGKNAGVKHTVGIVTYAKNYENFLLDADMVIDNYKELIKLLEL